MIMTCNSLLQLWLQASKIRFSTLGPNMLQLAFRHPLTGSSTWCIQSQEGHNTATDTPASYNSTLCQSTALKPQPIPYLFLMKSLEESCLGDEFLFPTANHEKTQHHPVHQMAKSICQHVASGKSINMGVS